MDTLIVNGEMIPHKIIRIRGDGACLFRSLSMLMYGTQSQDRIIRKTIVEYVVSNWERFQILSYDKDGNNYLTSNDYSRDMSKHVTYGTYCEIKAAGEVFPFLFEIYRDCKIYTSCGIQGHPVRRLRITGPLDNGHFEAYSIESTDDSTILITKKQKTIIKDESELQNELLNQSISNDSNTPVIEEMQDESIDSNSSVVTLPISLSFGTPTLFNEYMLPTRKDIILRLHLLQNNSRKSLQLQAASIAREIESIWKKTKIPIITSKSVNVKVLRFIKEYKQMQKHQRNSEMFNTYIRKLNVLFDIAICRCAQNNCKCKLSRKIPKTEMSFIFDQRGPREQSLLNINKQDDVIIAALPSATDTDKSISNTESDFFMTSSSSSEKLSQFPRSLVLKRLSGFAMECDRYGVSDRVAAALASSLLKDLNITDDTGKSIVIDKNKVRRDRQHNRQLLLKSNSLESGYIKSFSFDSKKDRTLTQIRTDDKVLHPRMVNETHITILKQPNSVFLGYAVADDKSKAAHIALILIDFFQQKNLDISNLLAVCCDGEVKNTGIHGGILRYLEKYLKKPLHWFICMLHLNELPFRHLTAKIDSSFTTGPKTTTGSISKALEDVEKPVKNFRPVPFLQNSMPLHIDNFELSTDERYLYEISKAVSSGECPDKLVNKNPGLIHHARWLTKACRILRLYVSTEEPSQNLSVLVKYIIQVYVPVYFDIKYRNSCKFGSIHFFNIIKFSRQALPSNYFSIIKNTLRNNFFFAHSENLLLAMLFDENPEMRRNGFEKILHLRNTSEQEYGIVRDYKAPIINFDCENYQELIDWEVNITEPPLTRSIPYEELKVFAECNKMLDDDIINISCHIQATERHIQVVSQASSAAATKARREGIIAAKITSRKKRPKFDSKKDFFY